MKPADPSPLIRSRELLLAVLVLGAVAAATGPAPTSLCGPAPSSAIATRAPAPAPACGAPSQQGYATSFPAAESPLSEQGRWTTGKAVGLLWNDVQTARGRAFAAQHVGARKPVRYADPIAHLNTDFGSNQFAEGTVFRLPNYRNTRDKHEIELLLRFKISAQRARGYEVLWGQDGGICVVRWNGPLADYTQLGDCSADQPSAVAVDGDVLRVEVIGNRFTVYRNGGLVLTTTDPDSTWNDGQPGIGFWPTPGAILEGYGWRSFRAGSL